MNRILCASLLSTVLGVLGSVSLAADPDSWTGTWLAPDLPVASDPPWAFYNGETITQTDYLNINSTTEETCACFVQNAEGGFWNVTEAGVTVVAEFRVNKMEGTNAGAIGMTGFGPGRKYGYVLYLGEGWVQLGEQESDRAFFDPGKFVTVRITANDIEASVYLNDAKEPALTVPLPETSETDRQRLAFGDPSSYGGGDVDWKLIKWTDQGTFTP